MNKQFPFLLKKEKHILNSPQNTKESYLSNNSSNNSNNSKVSPFINLESKTKIKILTSSGEKPKEEKTQASPFTPDPEFHAGRWTEEEHSKFLKGILEYGNEWKMVQKIIKTRSSTQARSHAQKFFLKIKKIIKNKKLPSDPENLIKYIYNSNQNFNDGLPLTEVQRKRLLNVIISNLKSFDNEHCKNSKIIFNEIKKLTSQKEQEKTFSKIDNGKNIDFKNNIIIISNEDNNFIINNSGLDEQNNNLEIGNNFCSKKRKGSSFNRIFEIKKVIKYKYTNNYKKINESLNKKILEKSNLKTNKKKEKIKLNKILKNDKKEEGKTENSYNHNIICPIIGGKYIINNNIINITNNYNSNNNNKNSTSNVNNNNTNNYNNMNNNINKTNINYNNNNNVNDIFNNDNKFNLMEPLNDFGTCIKKNIFFGEDDFPKLNIFECQQKFLFDNFGFNDPFKNYFFNDNLENENNLSIREIDEEISMINKDGDFLNKLFE